MKRQMFVMLVLVMFFCLIGRSEVHYVTPDAPPTGIVCPEGEDSSPTTFELNSEQKAYLHGIDGKLLQQTAMEQDPNTMGWILPEEITGALVLEPSKLYHRRGGVTIKNGGILYVPSGTIVTFDMDGFLLVEPYGKLITGYSDGLTPVSQSSDPLENPLPPTIFVAEKEDLFLGYNYGIVYIDDPYTDTIIHHELNNVYIVGGITGIYAQNVELVVTNSFFFACRNGIVSLGPANLVAINNQFSFCGGYYQGFSPAKGYAIWRSMVDINDQNHPESFFYSQNNSIMDCDFGIYVRSNYYIPGENAPTFVSINDVYTYCYHTAISCTYGNLKIGVYHPGVYCNTNDQNFCFPITNLVRETQFPFQHLADGYRYQYLRPDSNFRNSGLGLAVDVFPGATTGLSGEPDREICDLGVHYPVSYVSTSTELRKTDLNEDGITDENDYQIFIPFWTKDITDPNDYLEDPNYPTMVRCDFNGDKKLNIGDSSYFAYDWNKPCYGVTTTIKIINEDGFELLPSQVSGYVEILFSDLPDGATQAYLIIDNSILGVANVLQGRFSALVDTTKLTNGYHFIKVVTLTETNNVIVSEPFQITLNNLLYLVEAEETFSSNKNYRLHGLYNGTKSIIAELKDYKEDVLGYNTYSTNFIDVTIPPDGFYNNQFCTLSIREQEELTKGNLVLTSGSIDKYEKEITKTFNPSDYPLDARMVFVVQNGDFLKNRKRAILQLVKACEDNNIPYVSLFDKSITYSNLYTVYNNPCVRYVYWGGYGGNITGSTNRTYSMIFRKKEGVVWDSWEEIPIYSWTTRTVPSTPPLPDGLDQTAADMKSLGMSESWNKKIVLHDVDGNGLYNDMAISYGMFSLQGQGSLDQIYISWRCTANHETGVFNFIRNSTEGLVKFFEGLGCGQSVKQALKFSHDSCCSTVNKSIWGENEEMNLGQLDGDDNLFIWGLGFGNINFIKLQ